MIFVGPKIPSKASPRGPGSTPGVQKRGPRAIPNDFRVGRKFDKHVKNESKRYSDFSGFRTMFGQPWAQNPSITTGLVLQCRLHQKPAPQTMSETMSWQFGIRKSPPLKNRQASPWGGRANLPRRLVGPAAFGRPAPWSEPGLAGTSRSVFVLEWGGLLPSGTRRCLRHWLLARSHKKKGSHPTH